MRSRWRAIRPGKTFRRKFRPAQFPVEILGAGSARESSLSAPIDAICSFALLHDRIARLKSHSHSLVGDEHPVMAVK